MSFLQVLMIFVFKFCDIFAVFITISTFNVVTYPSPSAGVGNEPPSTPLLSFKYPLTADRALITSTQQDVELTLNGCICSSFKGSDLRFNFTHNNARMLYKKMYKRVTAVCGGAHFISLRRAIFRYDFLIRKKSNVIVLKRCLYLNCTITLNIKL